MLIVAGALSVEDRLPEWRLADLMGVCSLFDLSASCIGLEHGRPALAICGELQIAVCGYNVGLDCARWMRKLLGPGKTSDRAVCSVEPQKRESINRRTSDTEFS